jgi:hypothetical protein
MSAIYGKIRSYDHCVFVEELRTSKWLTENIP